MHDLLDVKCYTWSKMEKMCDLLNVKFYMCSK